MWQDKSLWNIVQFWSICDERFTNFFKKGSLTAPLVNGLISKLITEILALSFAIILAYEIIYWSGIYLNLWEYHAKDIFTEVPIHCAHIYVRVNVAPVTRRHDIDEYYSLRKRFALFNWKTLNEVYSRTFSNESFVKYYFEFSPEDFSMNKEPEFGSTVEHLRSKVLSLLQSSDLFSPYMSRDKKNKDDVLVFNNKLEEVPKSKDSNYLSKVHIETGNVIDCILLYKEKK